MEEQGQGRGGAMARACTSKRVEEEGRGEEDNERPGGRRESERGKAKWECENERPKS